MSTYIGCSGWYYMHWIQHFYPTGLPKNQWLDFYSQHFPVVEINNTFYQCPSIQTIQRWFDNTYDDFRFIIKGNKIITHDKKLSDIEADLMHFYERISILSYKCAGILWQFPPSFKLNNNTFHLLERFCMLLKPMNITCLFEFRDVSWFKSDVLTLFEKYGFGYVGADYPDFYKKYYIPLSCNTVYIRRHGYNGDYYTSYNQSMLRQLSQQINTYQNIDSIKNIYVFFNNDGGCHAVKDAKKLMAYVKNCVYPSVCWDEQMKLPI